MSQLLAPAKTAVDGIPLWRRVRELMKEKGSRYSMTAVANRLGISRETLRLMLNGEREIYMFELEKIAQDLKLPMARILQEDIVELHEEIQSHRLSLQQLDVAMELAKQRLAIAQGDSEKAFAMLMITYLHLYQEQLAEAETAALATSELLSQIGLADAEYQPIHTVRRYLLTIYIHTKRYAKGLELLQVCEHMDMSSPSWMAGHYQNKGMCKQGLNELEEAKTYLYKALELMQDGGEDERYGRGCMVAAFTEYCDFNYSKAKELLNRALQHLQTDMMRLIAFKDLAKVLLKLQEYQAAERLIRETLQSEPAKESPEMEARLLILLSQVRGLPYHAEAVAGNTKYALKIRFLAARFLRVYYRRWFMRGRSKHVKAVCKMPRRSFPYDKYI